MHGLRDQIPPRARAGCACDDPFHVLSDRELRALHVLARGIVASDDLACDAVQEALVALWQQRAEPPDVSGWLVRTTVHKSLHVLRREERRARHEERAGAARAEACPLCDPAELAHERELALQRERALAALPRELGAAFALRSERGLEYEAIAAALAIPVGTVRSRLSRARAALAGRLNLARAGARSARRA